MSNLTNGYNNAALSLETAVEKHPSVIKIKKILSNLFSGKAKFFDLTTSYLLSNGVVSARSIHLVSLEALWLNLNSCTNFPEQSANRLKFKRLFFNSKFGFNLIFELNK